MLVRRVLRRVLAWLVNQPLVLRIETSLDRRRALAVPPHQGERRGHVLVTTVGLGNIGDQAMLEAFLDNSLGPVTALVPHPASLTIPERHRSRAVIEHVPDLVDGLPRRRSSSRARFLQLVSGAHSCSVVGADIMDGGYAPRESVLRSSVLELARLAGASTAVMGFSWNGRAHPAARDALRRISSTTTLYARDPLSAERLRADGIACRLVSDMVFAFDGSSVPVDLEPWITARQDRQVVIINVSGLLASRNLTPEYVEVVRRLRGSGVAILLLPHVLRPGDDDLAACREVSRPFVDDPDVAIVERQLAPAEVSWLAARADAVFTARMHLSILALNHGTPVCVVATQGKVEGMLSMFGLEQWAIQPESGLRDTATTAISSLLGQSLRDGLNTARRDVSKLAETQFAHVRSGTGDQPIP